ncbi:MAG TPA: ATP-binding protein [Mycobacteriales bacterium]|nr:ATP-binding protein [Mycobacteriales bacterium]
MSGTTILPSARSVRAATPETPDSKQLPAKQPSATSPRLHGRAWLRAALPRGIPMTAESFALRHRVLRVVLAIHLPALLGLGLLRGYAVGQVLTEIAPAAIALLAASALGTARIRALLVTLGLVWCSFVVLRLSGGSAEAHVHPLAVLIFVALYQDWLPIGTCVLGIVALYVVPTVLDPSLLYEAGAARRRAGLYSAAHLGAFTLLGLGQLLFWRTTEREQRRATDLATHLGRQELAAEREALARRQESYALMTNLARRSQSLVGRQLSTLDELERDERDPDVLAGLFALDHLATRMRRNAENLLVLAGAGAARTHQQPVGLDELLRGAVAEVEQYARVDLHLDASGSLLGGAVSDVAHLLAELLDNALTCSPPASRVQLGVAPEGEGLLMTVEDQGIGMAPARLALHNATLATDPDSPADDAAGAVGATLGFPVVRRLADRHGIKVRLKTPDSGRGLLAEVRLPARLIGLSTGAEHEAGALTPTALPGRRSTPQARPAQEQRSRRAGGLLVGAVFEPAPLTGPEAVNTPNGAHSR